jgi:hypothetical protein
VNLTRLSHASYTGFEYALTLIIRVNIKGQCMKSIFRRVLSILILSFSLLSWASTTAAYSIEFRPDSVIQPLSAPIEVSIPSTTFELSSGVSKQAGIGTVTLIDTSNNSGGTASASIVYYQFSINENIFIIGDLLIPTGLVQAVTYNTQANGDCSFSGAASNSRELDLGDMFGPSTSAMLNVTFLGFGPYDWTCDGSPVSLSLAANFLLTVTSSADSDNDGIFDSDEVVIGTDPNNDDTDDDGILDGNEVSGSCPSGTVVTDPLNADTDGDGLLDGTECGLIGPQGDDTDPSVFIADTDSLTTTNPADDDSDDDGLLDGSEDTNSNGAVDAGETDPSNLDSDDDGIQDGTESGLSAPQGYDTDTGIFIADSDPTTVTDTDNDDTDSDGLLDGEEDLNKNGMLDPGETDPLTPETPPPPPSISCLDATSVLISDTRQYQKSNRILKRKCGQRMTDECLAVFQAQEQAFVLLSMQQESVQQACYPQ